MIEAQTRRFQELVHRLHATESDNPVGTYLADVGIWARGLLDWTHGNARYTATKYFGTQAASSYVEEGILPLLADQAE